MNSHLFESFSRMIDKLPAKGVISAMEREHQMLENDLATNRPVPRKEAHSILNFCRFLAAIKSGLNVSPAILPPADTAFYRRTTDRLIKAGELPANAHELFDEAFTVPLLQSLEDVY
ncbi:MAG: hypothetical protein ACLQAH_11390 [Limisphaerales bacterium]